MSETRKQKLKVEIIWWVATLVLVVLVLTPILIKAPSYPFFFQNAVFIVAFVTITRYIFHLRISLIARTKWLKAFLILVSAILFFFMTMLLGDFHNFLDERGLQTLVTHLHVDQQTRTMNYIKNEMVFFGVGAIIAGVILPFRMIISLWRMRNRGTV